MKSLFRLCLVVTSLLVVSCGSEPEQYNTGPNPTLHGATAPATSQVRITVPPFPEDEDIANVRERSQLPIVYGQGAAGITFETTLAQASNLLSDPYYGPASNGLAAYREGVRVIWRSQEPRIPSGIAVDSQYQGGLAVPGEFFARATPLRPQQPLGDAAQYGNLFPGTGVAAFQAFARKLYNALEGKPDTYNCVATSVCTVSPRGSRVNISWDKLFLMLSNDSRKAIGLIILQKEVKPAHLLNDFDVITGSINSPAGNFQIGTSTWNNFLDTVYQGQDEIRQNPVPTASTVSITKFFGVVGAAFKKDGFGRTYLEPKPTDKLGAIGVTSGYSRRFKMRGKFIKVARNPAGIQLTLENNGAIPNATYLSMGFALPRNADAQMDLANKLHTLINTQLKEGQPANSFVLGSKTGDHAQGNERTFSRQSLFFNPTSKKGTMVSFDLQESTGKMSYVEAFHIDSAMDARIIPTLKDPIDASAANRSMAGFQIGQTIKLADIDVGTQEATLKVGAGPAEITQRADYSDLTYQASYLGTGGRVEPRSYHRVSGVVVGSARVTLGVKPDPTKYVQDSYGRSVPSEGKITYIRTGWAMAGMTKICGLDTFNPKPGQSDVAVKAAFERAVDGANGTRLTRLTSQRNAEIAAIDQEISALQTRLNGLRGGARRAVQAQLTAKEQHKRNRVAHWDRAARTNGPNDPGGVLVEARNELKPNFSCPVDIVRTSDGNSRLISAIYFPSAKVRLMFSNRELGSFVMYENPSEVR